MYGIQPVDSANMSHVNLVVPPLDGVIWDAGGSAYVRVSSQLASYIVAAPAGFADNNMARAPPVWEIYYGSHYAGGDRDILLISSEGPLPTANPAVIPRCGVRVLEKDCRRMVNQGLELSAESLQDDLEIVKARVRIDKTLELVGEEISKPGHILSRSHVLQRIETVLKSSRKSGVVLYYCGHGGRNSGDWCFADGFITFQEIMSLYHDHMQGSVLSIVSDCSYSGKWVKECCNYLDSLEVRPCGHSAVEKGVLIKVYASCRSGEVAAAPCFSVSGAVNDKNKGFMAYDLGKTLRETQHSSGINFTQIQCENSIDEPCTLNPKLTSWNKKMESSRIYLVRGNNKGKAAWHYVLLNDDDALIADFVEKTQGARAGTETINIEKYGRVLKSGFGQEPPNEAKDWLEKNHFSKYK